MQRHWQVHGQLHPVELATTGVPEGDSLSVTAMLAINQLWTGLLNHPNLRLHAFADNWAYATFDATMHMHCLPPKNCSRHGADHRLGENLGMEH